MRVDPVLGAAGAVAADTAGASSIGIVRKLRLPVTSGVVKRVLLTGATGFVGRHVLRQLLAFGVPVTAVVRPGSADRLGELAGLVDLITTQDLFQENAAWWQRACEGIDTILHVAWYAAPGKYLQSPRNLDCLQGTLSLARGAVAAGVRRFVGVGTCFEYDLTLGQPAGYLSTDTPLRPATTYAACKVAAFVTLAQWLATQSVEFLWARLFYLYGEGENPQRLVPYLHARLRAGEPAELTSGAQIRDFLDVSAAAEQLVAVTLSSRQGPLNICSGEGITVRALAERIADHYNGRELLRFGARPDNRFDPPCVVGVRASA